MAEYITKIRTSEGDKQIDYRALANKPITKHVVTLSSTGWSASDDIYIQSVAIQAVSSDEGAQLIQPIPAVASQAIYNEIGVMCTSQSAGLLTFSASEIPSTDLTIYVVIQEVDAK